MTVNAINVLHQLSSRLVGLHELDQFLEAILDTAMAVSSAPMSTLQLYDEQKELHIFAQRGIPEPVLQHIGSLCLDCALCEHTAQQQRRVLAASDPVEYPQGTVHLPKVIRELGMVAIVSVPVIGLSGTTLGVFTLHWNEQPGLSEDTLLLIDIIAHEASKLIEHHRREAALKQANQRKSEFLAILAHELRNPLAPIRNALGILKRAEVDGTAVPSQTLFEIMDRQVDHMVRLVDDLLEISRIERGKIVLRREPIILSKVLSQAIEVCQPQIDASGHRLSISQPEQPIWLDVDPVRLTQVVANLINNAVKFTGQGGAIDLTATTEADQRVVISVRDNGPGIASELLPSVFDLFAQSPLGEDPLPTGLGVGLALVKGLVELHGGTVVARSEGPGCGSEFIVCLPMLLNGITPLAESAPASSTNVSPSSHRLLVVDDNRDAADSLAMMLKMLGHEVVVVYDAGSALEQLSRYQPEFMFLDLGMPGMDGYELARRVRQMNAHEGVVITALTGWGQQDAREKSRAAGFDYHLVKPVDVADIESIMRL
jgi:signal transduction histidine kinase/CheY-like chemotaxis protein